jgi:colanic acid/amylovoran biosynthesis glycosyltransferase
VRVAYVLKRFPRLSQTFVLAELLGLQDHGVDLTVLAGRGSDEAVTHPDVARLTAPVTYVGADEERAARAVADAVAEQGVTHLHAHFATWASRVTARAGALAGVPYSFTAHATDIYRADVDRALLARLVAGAAFAVTVTDDNAGVLRGLVTEHGREGRVVRLYNGLDLERLTPGPPAAQRSGEVLAVGRLVAKKGFDDLVRAVGRLRAQGRELEVTVVGDGPERPALEGLAKDLGVDLLVTFAGAADSAQVADRMRRAALLAVPCVVTADGDRDALPTVVVEAMALGLPVVATDVNGLPEMVQDGLTGAVVPERDVDALAAALTGLLDDPAGRDAYAAAGRERAERLFDRRATVATLAGLFAGGPA